MLGKPKNRYQAFAVHIGISAVIFIILTAIIVFIWYPGFLFHTDGGWNGIRLVAGVDFIIGPTLTLIVYKVGKKGLMLDLTLIGLVQFFCLAGGTWIVYEERPVTVFYMDGTYHAVSKEFFDTNKIDPEKALSLDDHIPAKVYIKLPEDKEKRMKLLIAQIITGPLYAQPDRYLPYKENLDRIMQDAMDPATVDKSIADKLSKDGALFKYISRYSDGYIEINRNTGEYINIYQAGT